MAVQRLDGRCCWEGFDNLMVIKIKDCSAVVELPMLGHLPHLKSLYLRRLEKVRSIGPSFYNVEGCSKTGTSNNINGVVVFGALERLELNDMPNLIEWTEVDLLPPNELVIFPRLECLTIRGCSQLVRAPSHFPSLKELSTNGMESSLPLENICGIKLTSLTSLSVSWIKELLCLPNGLFSNNHNLSVLNIEGCEKMRHLTPSLQGGRASLQVLRIRNCLSLRELPDDLQSLNSLEEFFIDGCPSLKSIPHESSQKGFTSLRKLWIGNCRGLTNLPIGMVESFVPSLEFLVLHGLSSITNLVMVIECLHRMPRLIGLAITEVPKFSIKLDNIGYLNNLQALGMGSPSSWGDIVSFNETVDAMLLHFISLRRLSLSGMEHWDCLPGQLQHLHALELLSLSGFGIEEFPEWFGNLISLERLNLYSLKKLRHLPSTQAMLRLSKLTFLSIRDCPLLLKDKSSNTERSKIIDSECTKISHIPTIRVG